MGGGGALRVFFFFFFFFVGSVEGSAQVIQSHAAWASCFQGDQRDPLSFFSNARHLEGAFLVWSFVAVRQKTYPLVVEKSRPGD